jgi:hypothetical protein
MLKKSKIVLSGLIVLAALTLSAAVFLPNSIVSAQELDYRGVPGAPGNPGGLGGNGQGNGTGAPGQGNGIAGQGAGYALTPLSDTEQDALQKAILEEYGALNLYNSVIEQFGDVIPFSQIARSEQQHVNALVRQAEKYGVDVPANPGLTAAPTFATLTDACQAGVDAEKADAALYDELIPVTTHTDLIRVYQNLQSASLNNHLVEFETCN